MVHGDFEWGFKANLNCTIIFYACACALCFVLLSASNNSVNTHQNENRFLTFGSLKSNAEVENAMISDSIIVCYNFRGI